MSKKSDIAAKRFTLVTLRGDMHRRRKMPAEGWHIESAEMLGKRDDRVVAITGADFWGDVVKAVDATIGDQALSRSSLNWEREKGSAMMRATVGLDEELKPIVVYVHRKMIGRLLEVEGRYMGSPQFWPCVAKIVQAKWLISYNFAAVSAENGDVVERKTWWAAAVALGEDQHLLPQCPMYAHPPAGFSPAIRKALKMLSLSTSNKGAAKMARALLDLKPGDKLPEFDMQVPWKMDGERLEAWQKITSNHPKAKRRQAATANDPKNELRPKTKAAEKRQEKGVKKGMTKFKRMCQEASASRTVPPRFSPAYMALCKQKSFRAYIAVGMHLWSASRPVRFTAQWETHGPMVRFECQGVVDESSGFCGKGINDFFVQCFDVDNPSFFYWWWTFPVADYLGLASGLLPKQKPEDQIKKGPEGLKYHMCGGRFPGRKRKRAPPRILMVE